MNQKIKQTQTPTTVVNIHHKQEYDVYIGRPGKGQDGYFGNPIILRKGASRHLVLLEYKLYFKRRLETDPEFKQRILELKGKRLGCFCKPHECHGDVIVEYLNSIRYIREAIIVEESLDIHQPYLIKVKDYTTEIVCRYNPSTDEYYIQRGDGEILQTYTSDRVIYKRLLKS